MRGLVSQADWTQSDQQAKVHQGVRQMHRLTGSLGVCGKRSVRWMDGVDDDAHWHGLVLYQRRSFLYSQLYPLFCVVQIYDWLDWQQ